jgi:hypothetical protein
VTRITPNTKNLINQTNLDDRLIPIEKNGRVLVISERLEHSLTELDFLGSKIIY